VIVSFVARQPSRLPVRKQSTIRRCFTDRTGIFFSRRMLSFTFFGLFISLRPNSFTLFVAVKSL
jgi:hypothetical protein